MESMHKPSAAHRRGSVGIVVHTTASEVESVSGGKTTARSSFLIQQDAAGRRTSVLGLPNTEALAESLRESRRSSIGAGMLIQPQIAGPRIDEDADEDEDEVWDGKASDTDRSEDEEEDPLAPERLLSLADTLDHSVKDKTSISPEQAALLRRIIKSAASLLKDPCSGSQEVDRQEADKKEVEKTELAMKESDLTKGSHAEHVGNGIRPRSESQPGLLMNQSPQNKFAPLPRSGGGEKEVTDAVVPVEENENDEAQMLMKPRRAGRAKTLNLRSSEQKNPEKGAMYFKQFLEAKQIVEIEESFQNLLRCCEATDGQAPHISMSRLPGLPWKAAKVWELFKTQVEKDDYKEKKLAGQSVAVIGAGPVGLRVAMELALAGASVTVIEKRGEFVRINRLHLWDWVKQDLIAWGAKVFYPPGGTFGADKDYCHIGISELQSLLLKCCLLLGVNVELGIEFEGTKFIEGKGWTVQTAPPLVQSSRLCINALVCCDGAASRAADGYGAKSIAGGLGKAGQAIGVVANFVNKRTKDDRDLRQFSWARQFNVPLFTKCKKETGADLENIVYYRGEENHYLIMTPSKRCLVDTGCLKSEQPEDGLPPLHASNVELGNLQEFAKSVASHFDLPTCFTPSQSVMAFDFSDTHRHEQAVLFVNADGTDSPLPVCLCGDALLEPFWPTGLGCVRGFLSALDCVSNLKRWVETGDRDFVLRYSDASYSQLKSVDGQTKDAILKPDSEWRVDPSTRYRGFRA